jgi:drug/metabolite transporter (DMT)-like permease
MIILLLEVQNNNMEQIQTTPEQRQRAILELIATALLWSLGGLLIKWVNWNPIAIAGMRSAIAALLMIAFCRPLQFSGSFVQIGGAVLYTMTVILFVLANKLTTAANAILLQYTAPIYVALFGKWFLGEKTHPLDWWTIGFTVGGMVLFFQDNLSAGGFWGNIAAIASGVAFAGLAMFTRKQKNGSSLESMLLGNVITAIIGLPFMFGSQPGIEGWIGLGYWVLSNSAFRISFIHGHSSTLRHWTAY